MPQVSSDDVKLLPEARPKFWQLVSGVLRRLGAAELGLIAAAVAFYALLGLFPTLAALTAIAGLAVPPDTVLLELDRLSEILPEEAAAIVLSQVSAVAGQGGTNLTFALGLSIGIALFAARRATKALLHGLSLCFGTPQSRGFLAQALTEVAVTATLMIGGLILSGLLVALPIALAFFPLGGAASITLAVARWLLVGLVFMAGLALLYRFGPVGRAVAWRLITPGALVASVLWFAGSYGFSFYVGNFGSYNETFGSLGGVVILLTWMWLSAFIAFIGATIDAEIESSAQN